MWVGVCGVDGWVNNTTMLQRKACMGLWPSCLTEGTLCLALREGRAAGALLQMSPRPGQSLCAGASYEHSVPAWPCRSTVRPEGHVRLFGAAA